MGNSRTNVVKESGKLGVLTTISRVLGLLREITRTSLLGTGTLGEAFSAAYNTPNLFRKLLAEGAMSVAFIPTMKTHFVEGDAKKTHEFLSAVFTVFTIVLLLVVSLGVVTAFQISHVYAALSPGNTAVTQDTHETAVLIQIMFPYLLLVGYAAFLQGILNASNIFVPSGIGPILFNLSFLLVPPLVIRFSGNAARAMAIGVLVGGFLQAICQLPAVVRLGLHFKFMNPLKALKNEGMKHVLLLMAPTLVGIAAYEFNAFICTGLAYGVGAATSIQISLRLQELILGIFVVSVATVLLPELTGYASSQNWEAFVKQFSLGLSAIILIAIPVSVFSIIERVDIVAVLFQDGKFNRASVLATASIFFMHSLGLVFIAVNRVITPVFYAQKDAKQPMIAGILSFLTNTAIAWILSRVIGGNGIAAALSIASAVNTFILLVMLTKKHIPGMNKALMASGIYSLKMLLYSIPAGTAAWGTAKLLHSVTDTSSNRFVFAGIPFLGSAIVFVAIGIGTLLVFRDPVAGYILQALRSRQRSAPALSDDGDSL
ncbi:MAG TPA: murein biosynthesis integral membrane protein MurJ [Spirochaetia bacterium]|nr:murein biosynthesis integral membrane protein MurJ [Spirochaetales bacterium]HPD80871.1 murein biosynthesis integral membrane protein MurJ [Spirochaetales bacterium]HQK34124.1 murein biosynthesis integral membrane protein MurJ [Spirochaetales bacterium]HRS64609.1 murein biosynthesis integral membrane protein MurJ [Spirochaetia bacterium]HRV28717.1 murein biosynthesis integral membrane protein MurJ [Spirochaetia bacterium]